MVQWFSIKDQPTPKDKVFLGYVKLSSDPSVSEIQTCWWSESSNKYFEACNCGGNEREDIKVTHWMPLPKPPEK